MDVFSTNHLWFIHMVAGVVFAFAGLVLLFRKDAGDRAANIELGNLKLQSSSAGLVVFFFGALFFGAPLFLPELYGGFADKANYIQGTSSCVKEKAQIQELESKLLMIKQSLKENQASKATVLQSKCRVQGNSLDASMFAISTPCPAIGDNIIVNTDQSKKTGLTLADNSKPGKMQFYGFNSGKIASVLISLKVHYPREQTLIFWNLDQHVASLQITPHHLIFNGSKHKVNQSPFKFRITNDIKVNLENSKARLYVNGMWLGDTLASASSIDRMTFNGLIEQDFVYLISGAPKK